MTIVDLPILTCLFNGGIPMESRWLCGAAALLICVLPTAAKSVWAGEPGRLAVLTAKQGLCDEVAVALADGRITSDERYDTLQYAKTILKPVEYQSFKRCMDRLSPPKPATSKRTAAKGQANKVAKAKAKAGSPAKTETSANHAVAGASGRQSTGSKSASGLVIPASATLPDRVAFVGEFR
jgi:hypothetical protein